jgi:hypothetical protein
MTDPDTLPPSSGDDTQPCPALPEPEYEGFAISYPMRMPPGDVIDLTDEALEDD